MASRSRSLVPYVGSGPNLGGQPLGYRIVDIDGNAISTLYKGIGEGRVIDITSPSPIASGQTYLSAQIYSEQGPTGRASYSVDGGEMVPMQVMGGRLWDTATALWDTTKLEAGRHSVAIEAKDDEVTFSSEIEVRISEDGVVPMAELVTHFDVYRGHCVKVTGEVNFVAMGPPYAEAGTGAVLMKDETGTMLIVASECITPPPPTLDLGDLIRVTAVPLLRSIESLGVLQEYVEFLPEGLVVGEEGESKAVRVMMLTSGDDIEKLAG